MTATECVILVDEQDNQIGLAEKLEAHEKSLLHRAFSVFIVRRQPQLEILLQQRALHKYHSAWLWTNTCCSHPREGESVIEAGERRLREELGVGARLKDIGWFKYHARFENGLSEHEVDHVLIAEVAEDIVVQPNPEEVHAYQWVSIEDLERDLAKLPEKYTQWLGEALRMVKATYSHI
jgi:isopentenyl-diphosphate delta-isomerase